VPIYEYRRPDGSTFEVTQPFSDDALTHDPETGVEVRRVLHAPAVHFKGSGFYNTDYGTRRRQRENADGGGESSGGKDSGGKDSGGESSGGKGSGGESSGGGSSTKEGAPASKESGGSASSGEKSSDSSKKPSSGKAESKASSSS
jgi:putative FmdB family regulatory protein